MFIQDKNNLTRTKSSINQQKQSDRINYVSISPKQNKPLLYDRYLDYFIFMKNIVNMFSIIS